MNLLKKDIRFISTSTVDLNKNIIHYFVDSGFKQIATNTDCLRFSRGSLFSNMWTFNPLKWKSEISVEIIEQEVIANFTIDFSGQVPTLKEEQLWDSFIENFKTFLHDPTFDFMKENEKRISSTKRNSLKFVGWAFFGAIIGGIPAGIIAYFTGIKVIVSVGACVGAIFYLLKKINDEKLKMN